MIPAHLKGKSAIQISTEMAQRFWKHPDVTEEEYMRWLETTLVIAIKDALCAADMETEPTACGRAIAFLNHVRPHDPAEG